MYAQLWLFNTQEDDHFQQYGVTLIAKHIPIGIIDISYLRGQLNTNKLHFGTQTLGHHPKLTVKSTTNAYPLADLAIKCLGMGHDTFPRKVIH